MTDFEHNTVAIHLSHENAARVVLDVHDSCRVMIGFSEHSIVAIHLPHENAVRVVLDVSTQNQH